jgi:hypothetical protein
VAHLDYHVLWLYKEREEDRNRLRGGTEEEKKKKNSRLAFLCFFSKKQRRLKKKESHEPKARTRGKKEARTQTKTGRFWGAETERESHEQEEEKLKKKTEKQGITQQNKEKGRREEDSETRNPLIAASAPTPASKTRGKG